MGGKGERRRGVGEAGREEGGGKGERDRLHGCDGRGKAKCPSSALVRIYYTGGLTDVEGTQQAGRTNGEGRRRRIRRKPRKEHQKGMQ